MWTIYCMNCLLRSSSVWVLSWTMGGSTKMKHRCHHSQTINKWWADNFLHWPLMNWRQEHLLSLENQSCTKAYTNTHIICSEDLQVTDQNRACKSQQIYLQRSILDHVVWFYHGRRPIMTNYNNPEVVLIKPECPNFTLFRSEISHIFSRLDIQRSNVHVLSQHRSTNKY